ncbi:hypothetical protein [Paraburkholderia sediminicola]|jgi:hypothetical protein|uniref:hypothetical protein n=1 Tax=Paraburkholderia sediminicola TaxID=458836 RepID=UPI0038B6B6CB
MNENGQAHHGSLVDVNVDVLPLNLIEMLNATIDETRHNWNPVDGRRESAMAKSFANLLRENACFQAIEAQACTTAQLWATTMLRREVADEPLHVLRCVGPDADSQSYLRHFDSHILTMLVPLRLAPDGDRNGDLIMHALPREAKSEITNLLTKTYLFFEHGLPFFIRRSLSSHALSNGNSQRVVCAPGNVYIFNGLITLHHNLDVVVGERRMLIIHHYDAGLTPRARSVIRSFRMLRDRLAGMY